MAEALGEIGSENAVGALCEVLKDRKPDVRKAAAEVLVKMGSLAVEELIAAIQDKEWVMRQEAAWALGQIGGPIPVEALCNALRDEDMRVSETAAEALDRLGHLPDAASEAWYAVAKRDWERVVRLGKLAVDPLCSALQAKNSDMRFAAARALGQIGDQRAIEQLRAILNDEESYVSDAAREALRIMGQPVA